MVALPAITGKKYVIAFPSFSLCSSFFFFLLTLYIACLYGDLGSDDFVNALQQAKYLDALLDFTKEDWLQLLKQ